MADVESLHEHKMRKCGYYEEWQAANKAAYNFLAKLESLLESLPEGDPREAEYGAALRKAYDAHHALCTVF